MKDQVATWARILAPFISGAVGVFVSVYVQQRVMASEVAAMRESVIRIDERGSTFARLHDADDNRRVTDLQRQIDDLKSMRSDVTEMKSDIRTVKALLEQHQKDSATFYRGGEP